jgi:tRNA-2-methylthio-N6-dimethylallyladenosine synthase
MKKVHIKTYGCQMNVYDSDKMAASLAALGYTGTETPDDADLVILNTCHIREKAAEKVYSELGRLRDLRAEKKQGGGDLVIGVAGCVAQAEGAEMLRRAPYVDLVFGPQTYHRLPELVAQAQRAQDLATGKGRGVLDTTFPIESKFDTLPEAQGVTGGAAFLTVQEGCDKFCSFCVVPYTRGAEFSRPAADVLKEARQLVAKGALEITLLGQNVNAWHGAAPNGGTAWGLGRLIRELAGIEGLERIRYTTSHPRDMDADLIAAHGEVPQLMPYLHLPVQSGSDRVLSLMNRKHTAADYLAIIEQLRAARPDLAFSSDFIVGHPGETDADFQATLRLVETVGYAQAYSFMYSPRPGTPAAVHDDQIAPEVKKDRLAALQALLNIQQVRFNQASVGQTVPVLIESTGKKAGQLVGRTPHMQSVHLDGAARLVGAIVAVAITAGYANSLHGQIQLVADMAIPAAAQ